MNLNRIFLFILVFLFISSCDDRGKEMSTFYPSGKKKTLFYVKNDKVNGDYIQYYETGEIELKKYYINNKTEGTDRGFYKNGQKKYEVNFKNDVREGLASFYLANGKVSQEEFYKKGKLIKSCDYWYNGKEIYNIKYYNGLHHIIKEIRFENENENGKVKYVENYSETGHFLNYRKYDSTGRLIGKNMKTSLAILNNKSARPILGNNYIIEMKASDLLFDEIMVIMTDCIKDTLKVISGKTANDLILTTSYFHNKDRVRVCFIFCDVENKKNGKKIIRNIKEDEILFFNPRNVTKDIEAKWLKNGN